MRAPIRISIGLLCLVAVTTVMANDGAIEIWEPATITESGHYFVSRDISHHTTVITITAENVHLDLNGYSLSNSGASGYVIFVDTPASNVTIEGGTIIGGVIGVKISNGVDQVTIRRTRIRDPYHHCIEMGAGHSAVIEDNVMHNCGLNGAVLSCYGSVIHGNVIRGSGNAGMIIWRTGNRVSKNLIEESGSDGLHLVSGAWYNHITDNVFFNNVGYGLTLHSSFNVYRSNRAMSNSGTGCGTNPDFCLNGPNTSHGDNYMPGQL
jgi:nitrous oxidase accessory protein NosD